MASVSLLPQCFSGELRDGPRRDAAGAEGEDEVGGPAGVLVLGGQSGERKRGLPELGMKQLTYFTIICALKQ